MFLPAWVRALGLSVFNIVFAGGQAIGAFVWGLLAQWTGLVPSFLVATAVMAVGTATVVVWPLRDTTGLSRELAVFMPDPVNAVEPDPDDGRVLVTLTYTVAEDRVPAFLAAMTPLRLSRLRTGATRCELFRDGADPTQFVQVSEYPTWAEHLRQHTERLTGADQELYSAAQPWPVGRPRCGTCSWSSIGAERLLGERARRRGGPSRRVGGVDAPPPHS